MTDHITIHSEALHREIRVQITAPDNGKISRVLLLLHGKTETDGDHAPIEELPEQLELQKLAHTYHLLIATPFMENRYYISSEEYDCNTFVAEELPEWLKRQYALSQTCEVVLAGISMGGYGAVLIAAHTGNFDKILSVSGAFLSDNVRYGTEIWGYKRPIYGNVKESYLRHFFPQKPSASPTEPLPLADFETDAERNVLAALPLLVQRKSMPHIYLSFGTEEGKESSSQPWLYKQNMEFCETVKEHGIACEHYVIEDGRHDADCFLAGLHHWLSVLWK